MLPLAVLALAGLVVAAVKLTKGPDLVRVAAGLQMPLAWVQAAARWGKSFNVPLEWVLTTILVESANQAHPGGNPRGAGDADGRSRGLMQVNVVAHAAEIHSAGLTPDALYDPIVNIQWGVKYLNEFRQGVLDALGGRTPPIPLDEITRLAYKGPSTVYAALRAGKNPATITWAPDALTRWRSRMARVRALTNGAPRV